MLWQQITAGKEETQVKRLILCRHGETQANAQGVLQGKGINLGLNDRVSRF